MPTLIYNIIALVFIAGIVLGIRLMSSPETAIKGNLLGAICILGSIILTLTSNGVVSYAILWISMAIGGLVGCFFAVKVAMTQMPQLVALLNGFGGGASAIVAFVVLVGGSSSKLSPVSKFTGGLALVVGAVTLSGSIIAAAKLDQKITQLPVILRGHTILSVLTLIILGIFILFTIAAPVSMIGLISIFSLLVALILGVLFSIRVGGADMPITISFLNSLSGIAASITGFAILNPLLVAVGAIVGAAGIILTRIMCRAMNRTIFEVLIAKSTAQSFSVKQDGTFLKEEYAKEQPKTKATDNEDLVISVLTEANKIVIVPGYGMALAQAQHQVNQLFEKLAEQGKEVVFAIHPVAGRMPGHMNVLLAEAGVPYDKLLQMDDINPKFKETDVVVVVGANDVINPAAKTAEGTPIYGMPVLNVTEAKHIIICNKDTEPGYAGVNNPLYEQEKNVTLFLGDAAQTFDKLLKKLY